MDTKDTAKAKSIKELRLARGWSIAKMARLAGICGPDMGRIEAGRMKPYAPQVRRLAKVLGITVEEVSRLANGARQ